ncbi:unnamed protein product [Symbiodinium natans]|uniref:Uncharacterized protein n=1 Tax=Symbiodinium natans TaxID=878477 RepID=A0A812QFD3_9DINO|nr:unnamed protein product [Symbiodinium natans]
MPHLNQSKRLQCKSMEIKNSHRLIMDFCDMFPTVPTRTFHSDLGDKMRKIEAWHGFLETMNSWLALQDKAYVNEIRLCISVKDEIRQDLLPPDTAARSAKLFEFGKVGAWLNGQIKCLLQATRRFSHLAPEYSIVVLDGTPSYVKRQYVALHGNANSWSELTKSLKYFEEQLRMCDVPTAANRGMAGEKGGKGGKGGQGESKSGKGTGKPTSKGEKGEKGEKGGDKGKKKKNRGSRAYTGCDGDALCPTKS